MLRYGERAGQVVRGRTVVLQPDATSAVLAFSFISLYCVVQLVSSQ